MHLILVFSIIMSWQVQSAFARDITVLKSAEIKPYTEVLDGFKGLCDYNITEYILSESNDATIIRNIKEKKPRMIFTIGLKALELAKRTEGIPIVFSMVSNPETKLDHRSNISGISMNVSSKEQLATLLLLIPDIRKIGIVYDPGKSSALFEKARDAAASQGITLISRKVNRAKDVPLAIKELMQNADAFWMIPDSTVIYPESLEFLMLTSFEKRIPVLSFSDIYLEMGALVSLNIDTKSIGQQACELTKGILSGANTNKNQVIPPNDPILSVNPKRTGEFGIDLNMTQKGQGK